MMGEFGMVSIRRLRIAVLSTMLFLLPSLAFAQSPWEYDTTDGHLVRVLSATGRAEFSQPRGLRFAPNGLLYCVARDEVVGFDFSSGECLGAIVRMRRLHGQAVALFP